MAREKALYGSHAVAAVAAINEGVATRALKLIEVEYEVLPHVLDVARRWAMRRCCTRDVHDRREAAAGALEHRQARRVQLGRRRGRLHQVTSWSSGTDTQPVRRLHQAHACLASVSETTRRTGAAKGSSSCAASAQALGMEQSKLRGASRSAGNFGGKTVVYLERSRWHCRKAGRPVKMVISRRKCSGRRPHSGAKMSEGRRYAGGRIVPRRCSSTRPGLSRDRRCSPDACARLRRRTE